VESTWSLDAMPVARRAGENPICQAICPVTKFKSQSTSRIGQEGERHRGMVSPRGGGIECPCG